LQEITIAGDEGILGYNAYRVRKVSQDSQAAARDVQPAFNWLKRIGDAAHDERLGFIGRGSERFCQQLRCVLLGQEACFKV
jgi:hypothetical protein